MSTCEITIYYIDDFNYIVELTTNYSVHAFKWTVQYLSFERTETFITRRVPRGEMAFSSVSFYWFLFRWFSLSTLSAIRCLSIACSCHISMHEIWFSGSRTVCLLSALPIKHCKTSIINMGRFGFASILCAHGKII